MSLRFAYKALPTQQPAWTLSGRQTRPKAMVFVSIIRPLATDIQEGILDTGADDTVFPDRIATVIGLDLTTAPTGMATSIGGAPVLVRFAEVTLRLTDGVEYREWPARVAFTSAPLRRCLLGYAGFLQFFDALFKGALEEVELTANHLYPGNP